MPIGDAARLRPAPRSRASTERARQSAPAAKSVLASKIRVPALRAGTVSRAPLVNRLRATGSFPYVTLIAPAGYGKTTLLVQWADRDERPFAWVSVDEHDNDATVFLAHVAAAVERVASRRGQGRLDTLPAVAAALGELEEPLVIVLDDAHLLRSKGSLEIVSVVADNLPKRSLIALAGRVPPRVPLARLRSRGRLLELGVDELSLSTREAGKLLQEAGVELPQDEVERLAARTEGWPVGLYLAAVALREADRSPQGLELSAFAGDDRWVADYFRDECLAHLPHERLTFLRRTSVLERMSAPLCDAVLGRSDSALELAALERANLFVVPLDRRREWYRYHHLLRDLLRRELADREPALAAELSGRAADWFERHDDLEAALASAEAEDVPERVAGLLAATALGSFHRGGIADVERRLALFDDHERLARFPDLAAVGCWVHAWRGRPAAAERWLAAAERSETSGPQRVLRALLCRDGVEQMRRDAEAALAELPEESPWRPAALLLAGSSARLLGCGTADTELALAAEHAEATGATSVGVVAAAERALIAFDRDDRADADRLALEALRLAGPKLPPTVAGAVALAAATRALLRQGRMREALTSLERAEGLAPLLTHAVPWLAVQTGLELMRAHVVLRDAAGAKRLQPVIDEILALRPALGSLAADRDAVQGEIDEIPSAGTGHRAGLTAAELRLLPLLSTHYSFREIAEQLFVSRNTVKTQAISVYRKLGVSSRSDAIRRATELGLAPAEPPRDFIRAG